MRAEFQRAHDVGEQLLSLGERTQNSLLIVEGHYALGMASFYPGLYVFSRAHLKQALAHYDPAQSRAHIALYTQDPKVVCLIRLALDLWCLGYPDQAAMAREDFRNCPGTITPVEYSILLRLGCPCCKAFVSIFRQHVCRQRLRLR